MESSRGQRRKAEIQWAGRMGSGVGGDVSAFVSLCVLEAGSVGEMKIQSLEEKSPPCLPRFKLLCVLNVDKILMIGPDQEWLYSVLETVPLLLQCPLDGQLLTVPKPVALLSGGKFPREVAARIEFPV